VDACALLVIIVVDLRRIARSLPLAVSGDEWRYLYYANNLLHGFYSPRNRIFLWNGPAYPMLLMPFVKVDWIEGARYANAFLHAGAIAYGWSLLRSRLPTPWAVAAILLFGVYAPLQEHLPLLLTEVLCFFLVTAWIYHALKSRTSRTHTILAGCYLGVLCLTKVAFGAALTAFLVVMFVVWLRRQSAMVKAYLVQGALAFALCVPYLGYTYDLTGRAFYWSTVSPNAFYWLSSPYPDEWGDWYHQGWVYENPILRAHHKAIFDQTTGLGQNPNLSVQEQVFNMSTPEAGEIWWKQGVRNVREHPLKFAKNLCGNVVRLFLDVPVSVRGTPFVNEYTVWHLPMLALTAFAAIVAKQQGVRPPRASWPIGLFALLVFGAYSLGSGRARYVIPLVPMWWLGTACLLGAVYDARRPKSRKVLHAGGLAREGV